MNDGDFKEANYLPIMYIIGNFGTPVHLEEIKSQQQEYSKICRLMFLVEKYA